MGNTEKFKTDKDFGELGNGYVRKFFVDCLGYQHLQTSYEYVKEYDDVYYKNGLLLTETKVDKKAVPPRILNGRKIFGSDTGNMIVEFECSGEPSGIVTTKADLWLNYFIFIDELWIISVEKLRKIIGSYPYKVVPCGDGNKARGYLIRRDEIIEQFEIHRNIQNKII